MIKKKICVFLLLTLIIVSGSVYAKTIVEELDDGNYKVTFIYQAKLDVSEMYLAGDFPEDKVIEGTANNWDGSHPDWQMKIVDGAWTITKILKKGTYPYKFVDSDKNWMKDNEADTFVDDGQGGQNSVLRTSSNKMKGEFSLTGKVVNKVEYNNTDDEHDPIKIDNDFELIVKGTIQDEIGEGDNVEKVDRVKYSSQVNIEWDADDITKIDEMEIFTPDAIELWNTKVTLLTAPVDYTMGFNTKDLTNSMDPLGLVDAITDSEGRENGTTNPNDLLKNGNYTRRFKMESKESLPVNFNFAMTEYLDNTTEYLQDEESYGLYHGYANISKDFNLNGKELTIGSHLQYTKDVDGKLTDTEAVFIESKPIDNLTLKAQYTALTTKVMEEGSAWKIRVNISRLEPAEGAENKPMPVIGEVEEMHLVGSMQDSPWTPSDKSFALEKVAPGIWEGEFTNVKEGQEFKILWDTDNWNDYHEITASYETNGENIKLNSACVYATAGDFIYDRGDSALVEANYKIVDKKASMKARIKSGDFSLTKYKGDFTVGARTMSQNAYLPVADDSVMEDADIGYRTAYAKGKYNLLSNLVFNGELEYKVASDDKVVDDGEDIEEGDALSRKVATGLEWNKPVKGLDYITCNIEVDPEDTDDFEGKKKEACFETQISNIPYLKYLRGNIHNRLDSEVEEYYLESDLDLHTDKIAYVKPNVRYVKDPISGYEDDKAIKYGLETKLHHLGDSEDYIPYILLNYTVDDNGDNGLVENADYEDQDDNDNDWKQKVYLETEFRNPKLPMWGGLTTGLEFQQIEDNVIDYTPSDITKDEQYYVADKQRFIDWYSILTLETYYKFPYSIRADLCIKYDLNHGEISEYEDDAILIKLTKEINKRSTFSLSYNKQDEDEGEDYYKAELETVF
ncbi:MAG: hypothetical protein FH762_08385 [Firmicutes bacterium]|nr:hypothetical protein [Bacillota bacterium]